LYFGVGVLLFVTVVGVGYVINQNAQIVSQMKLITENSERSMPRPILTDSITIKPITNETTTTDKTT
jgi:hypothetical protein